LILPLDLISVWLLFLFSRSCEWVRVANRSCSPVLVSPVALSPHGLQRRRRSFSLRWSWAVECLVSDSTFSFPAACVFSRLSRRRAARSGVSPLQFAVKA
jgi:hypothetical protein